MPLAIGVAIYGLAFRLLAAQAGFGPTGVGVMGGAVFAGGSQIVAAQRLVAGAGALTTAIAGLALNLRLLLVTASIRDVFAGRPWWQIALGGASLHGRELGADARATRPRADPRLLVPPGGWPLPPGRVERLDGRRGRLRPSDTQPRSPGMDFAFTATFIAIARSLWKGRSDVLPWPTTAGVVAVSVRLLGLEPSWGLVLGGAAGAAVASVVRHD